jgi:lysozyme
MDPKLKAFLDLIGWSEGADYNTIVTGVNGPSTFTDFSDHPFAHGGSVTVRRVPLLISTAAGRYQVLAHYFEAYKAQLGLTDFSPASQDAVALQQMKERGVPFLLKEDRVQEAITACSYIWASFPGNSYGQGGKSTEDLLTKYQEFLTS